MVKNPNTSPPSLYTPGVSRTDHVCPDRRAKHRSENGARHFLIALSTPRSLLVLFLRPSRVAWDARTHEADFGASPFTDSSTLTVRCFNLCHFAAHFWDGLPPAHPIDASISNIPSFSARRMGRSYGAVVFVLSRFGASFLQYANSIIFWLHLESFPPHPCQRAVSPRPSFMIVEGPWSPSGNWL